MRIALIALHYSEYSWNLAQALASHHEVLAIFNENNFRDELGQLPTSPSGNLHIVVLPHVGKVSVVLANAWRIVAEVRRFRPDVVHCQENGKDYLILALQFLRRYPFVLTIHDPHPHSGKDARTRKSRYGWYLSILRNTCDAAITHGNFLREQAELLVPKLKGRVHPILHGPLGLDGHAKPLGWEQGNLLFFGRMEAYKGLAVFIAAVRLLASRGINVRGVVAGRGDDLEKHRESIAADPLFEIHDGYVARDKVMQLFARANIVVLPYTDGTQSGVAALAMGQARPVVASRVGSIPELVRDGVNGLLVPACDVPQLADALEKLIVDDQLARNMAQSAKTLADNEISWEALARETVFVYKSAMHRKGRHVAEFHSGEQQR